MLYQATNIAVQVPKEYLKKEIFEATQEKLILKVYDFAISKCRSGDMIKTNEAISALISALDFNNPDTTDISTQLLRLYQFAQEQMRKGEREIVLRILTELKETWKTVFTKYSTSEN